MSPRAPLLRAALAVTLLVPPASAARKAGAPAYRIEATPRPRVPKGFYRTPVRTGIAPGRFRPRREFAGLITAMANPPSWSRDGRMGLGVWVERPDRPPHRAYLPQVLHAGDTVHSGTRGLARVELPGGAVVITAAETRLRLAGDGAFPKPRDRVRIAVEPGLIQLDAPRGRPVQVEVPHGLFLLHWGSLIVDAPVKVPDLADPQQAAKLYLLAGRGSLHARGRHRRKRRIKVQAGQTLRWSDPDPVYWDPRRSDPATVRNIQEFFLGLEDGSELVVEEPPPLPITQPRVVEGLVEKRPPGSGEPRPPPKPSPDPFADPFKDPLGGDGGVPIPPFDPSPEPDPTGAPPKDPFGDDPFGKDPFGDDF